MTRVHWLAALALLGLACGDDSPSNGDDPQDSGMPGAGTSGGSGGMSGGTAGSSGGGTSGSSGGAGGSMDAAIDAELPDAELSDGNVIDGGGEDLWANCPTADDFVGPSSGSTTLDVTDDATYCVLFNENRTFAEERAAKAMVRLAPGQYPLGTTSGVNVLLPTCVYTGHAPEPAVAMAAPLSYSMDVFDNIDMHHFDWDASVTGYGPQTVLQLGFDINVLTGQTPSMVLNGAANTIGFDVEDHFSIYFCDDGSNCTLPRVLDSCSYDAAPLQTHALTFEGGNIELLLRIGESLASTEPGAFIGATGTWHDQPFDQRDYFKLIYVPFHHHFQRNFLVLFDEPIDGACGLRFSNLDPFEPTAGDAATVACDLNDITPVTITSHERLTE